MCMYIFSMNNKSDIKKLWDDMLNMKVLLLLNVQSVLYNTRAIYCLIEIVMPTSLNF